MSIKVKAMERVVAFMGKDVYKYVLTPTLYNRLSEEKVIKEAAARTGLAEGIVRAAWDECGHLIRTWATEGHSVAIPGLGTMRFGLRSKAVDKVEQVSTELITSRRVIFTPSVAIKRELERTEIHIACYNRDGKLEKDITSQDPGTVEDNETQGLDPANPSVSPTPTGSQQPGSQPQGDKQQGDKQQGDKQQGGQQPGGEAKPVDKPTGGNTNVSDPFN